MQTKNLTAHTFSDKTVNLTAPKSWAELTRAQLIYVSWLMSKNVYSSAEVQALCFARFTGIKVEKQVGGYWLCLAPDGRYFTIAPHQAQFFANRLDFLTRRIEEITPLPAMAGFTPVDSRLRGTPFIQYLACENYYQAFLHTQNLDFLRLLAACFYTGGEEFSDAGAHARCGEFLTVKTYVLNTVFLWYSGLKMVFAKNFPNFFRQIDIAADAPPEAPNMRIQINNMIRALTGGDVTKIPAVEATETWAALAELDAKARESAEMERRIKKMKSR
jgi:hypothetical protein